MTDYFTKKDALGYIYEYPDNAKLCPECFHELKLTFENHYYCPNEMCKCEAEYSKRGKIL
jgi:hypothetical protein